MPLAGRSSSASISLDTSSVLLQHYSEKKARKGTESAHIPLQLKAGPVRKIVKVLVGAIRHLCITLSRGLISAIYYDSLNGNGNPYDRTKTWQALAA